MWGGKGEDGVGGRPAGREFLERGLGSNHPVGRLKAGPQEDPSKP